MLGNQPDKGVWVEEENGDFTRAQVFKFPLDKEDIVLVEKVSVSPCVIFFAEENRDSGVKHLASLNIKRSKTPD